MDKSISAALDEARKELLDLSPRNTLINFRSLKARGVQVIDEIPREIFRIIVVEGKAMWFSEHFSGGQQIRSGPVA